MIKQTAYIHGKDLDNISFINLIILNDAKTISIFEFKNNSCFINIYDNTKLEIINNILYQIFKKYMNIKNDYEIKGNYIDFINSYINNQNVECNFMELKDYKTYTKKITRR